MRYLASHSADLSNPQHPPAFMGGQSKTMRQMMEIWPGLFKLLAVSLIIACVVLAATAVQHAGVHHTVTKISQ